MRTFKIKSTFGFGHHPVKSENSTFSLFLAYTEVQWLYSIEIFTHSRSIYYTETYLAHVFCRNYCHKINCLSGHEIWNGIFCFRQLSLEEKSNSFKEEVRNKFNPTFQRFVCTPVSSLNGLGFSIFGSNLNFSRVCEHRVTSITVLCSSAIYTGLEITGFPDVRDTQN